MKLKIQLFLILSMFSSINNFTVLKTEPLNNEEYQAKVNDYLNSLISEIDKMLNNYTHKKLTDVNLTTEEKQFIENLKNKRTEINEQITACTTDVDECKSLKNI